MSKPARLWVAGKETHLCLCFTLPFWISLSNQVEVFFVEQFFLFALSTALLLPATLALLLAVSFFFIFIDDKALSNLQSRKSQ